MVTLFRTLNWQEIEYWYYYCCQVEARQVKVDLNLFRLTLSVVFKTFSFPYITVKMEESEKQLQESAEKVEKLQSKQEKINLVAYLSVPLT